MLSDKERERLTNRETEDPKIRAVNDARVKKKLTSWLEDSPDVLAIFRCIPSEKLKDGLSDIDVYRLLTIAELIMDAKKFMKIEGELEKPNEWMATGFDEPRPANSTDIGRTVLIEDHVGDLSAYIGGKNPVTFGRAVHRVMSAPDKYNRWKDRFTPEEEKGATRVAESEHEYIIGL